MSVPTPTEAGHAPEPSPAEGEAGLAVASPAPAAPSRVRSLIREILETILLTVIIYVAVNFATGRYRVEGDSMQPTMHPDQYVLLDKVSYMIGPPERGDIIVFHYPFSQDRDFIKRVIGLPGETVTIEGGVVRVNGQPLQEPYISAPPQYSNTWPVPGDEYFVLGDNRNNSSDSHSWGMLKREFIVGRAVVVYWPPNDWRIVQHYKYPALTPGSN